MRVFKAVIFGLLVMALGMVFSPQSVSAFEGSGEASVDVLSTYVWRGQNLGGNEGVVQPSIGIAVDNFSFNLWANYDEELGDHTETDLTLGYSRAMEGYTIDVGFIYYALKGLDGAGDLLEDTKELYVGVSLDTVLSPSLTYYQDIDEGSGGFAVISVGHSLDVADKVGLDLGASLGFNVDNELMQTDTDGDLEPDTFDGLYNGEVSAALNYAIADGITVSPKIAYSFAASTDADDTLELINSNGESDVLYGGVGISVSF